MPVDTELVMLTSMVYPTVDTTPQLILLLPMHTQGTATLLMDADTPVLVDNPCMVDMVDMVDMVVGVVTITLVVVTSTLTVVE